MLTILVGDARDELDESLYILVVARNTERRTQRTDGDTRHAVGESRKRTPLAACLLQTYPRPVGGNPECMLGRAGTAEASTEIPALRARASKCTYEMTRRFVSVTLNATVAPRRSSVSGPWMTTAWLPFGCRSERSPSSSADVSRVT